MNNIFHYYGEFSFFMYTMLHPGRYLSESIKAKWWTQKQFADLIGKKVSEVNELINGKRNITILWDMILAIAFDDPEKKRINMQNDYDYYITKTTHDLKKFEQIQKRKHQIEKQDVFTQF